MDARSGNCPHRLAVLLVLRLMVRLRRSYLYLAPRSGRLVPESPPAADPLAPLPPLLPLVAGSMPAMPAAPGPLSSRPVAMLR